MTWPACQTDRRNRHAQQQQIMTACRLVVSSLLPCAAQLGFHILHFPSCAGYPKKISEPHSSMRGPPVGHGLLLAAVAVWRRAGMLVLQAVLCGIAFLQACCLPPLLWRAAR